MTKAFGDVRFRGKSGHAEMYHPYPLMTQCMVRPCVARGFVELAMRSCINVSGLSSERVVLPATMDISARVISLADRPRPGHLGHQCSHAPGRPILHLVSSSRRPRRVCGARHLAFGDQAGWVLASLIVLASKFRPWARTLQAIRASLLASAIASTLWCSRFLAASIQGLSP
jgi:hypothetical protein